MFSVDDVVAIFSNKLTVFSFSIFFCVSFYLVFGLDFDALFLFLNISLIVVRI